MKTTIKRENDNFLVIPLKHVSGLTVVVNLPGTPKMWSITHGNDHKKAKKTNFHHTSQICKSPWNPNTACVCSCKLSENTKMTTFGNNSETCIISDEPCKSPGTPK